MKAGVEGGPGWSWRGVSVRDEATLQARGLGMSLEAHPQEPEVGKNRT